MTSLLFSPLPQSECLSSSPSPFFCSFLLSEIHRKTPQAHRGEKRSLVVEERSWDNVLCRGHYVSFSEVTAEWVWKWEKSDSPLNSSISVGVKKRENSRFVFLIFNPNNVYNHFYLLNLHDRCTTHRDWQESESESVSRAPSLPRYRHILEKTHWTMVRTCWLTARCPIQYPRKTVHRKSHRCQYEMIRCFGEPCFALWSSPTHLLCIRGAVLHHVALQFPIELSWRSLPHH